jgi:hypothetical protein
MCGKHRLARILLRHRALPVSVPPSRLRRRREPQNPAPIQLEHHLMVAQPLAALHQTEVTYHAVMSAAHFCEPRVLEPTHGVSMHCAAIPSNLDEEGIGARLAANVRATVEGFAE